MIGGRGQLTYNKGLDGSSIPSKKQWKDYKKTRKIPNNICKEVNLGNEFDAYHELYVGLSNPIQSAIACDHLFHQVVLYMKALQEKKPELQRELVFLRNILGQISFNKAVADKMLHASQAVSAVDRGGDLAGLRRCTA